MIFSFAMFQQYKQTQDQQKVCICLLKLNGLKTSHKFHIRNGMVISCKMFKPDSSLSYIIPVSRILSCCGLAERAIRFPFGTETVMVAIPLVRRIHVD